MKVVIAFWVDLKVSLLELTEAGGAVVALTKHNRSSARPMSEALLR
jgi:hypothetical protein